MDGVCRRRRRGRYRRPFKRLGGAVYVPPTDSNIGRISVVADPQTATLALVERVENPASAGRRAGRAGPASAGTNCSPPTGKRRLLFTASFLAGRKRTPKPVRRTRISCSPPAARRSAACSPSLAVEPVPFWLYYFNVDDIDAAAERVKAGGGQIFEGPLELPDGSWIARCTDPQGAVFALQGKRNRDGVGRAASSEVGWSSEWGGFSSRGRLVKPALVERSVALQQRPRCPNNTATSSA